MAKTKKPNKGTRYVTIDVYMDGYRMRLYNSNGTLEDSYYGKHINTFSSQIELWLKNVFNH